MIPTRTSRTVALACAAAIACAAAVAAASVLATHVGVAFLFALAPGSAAAAAPGVQDRWSAAELGVLKSLSIASLQPKAPDPSNAVDGRPEAAALGKRLFNDPRLSRNGAVSCANCHAADKQFQDGLPVGRGFGIGSRRTMPIAGTAHGPWFFWDGRKDSLWSQALGPLEDGVEHADNRTRYAHALQTHYRADYEKVFGPLPDLAGLPADAGPLGSPEERRAWAALPEPSRLAVSRVFANLGKAIAAFVATLVPGESRFDRYVRATLAGDGEGQRALAAPEVNGLRLFIGKAQCATCHNGPLFTDQHFHNTGVTPRDPAHPDRGRAAGLAKLLGDEFNCLGPFSDAKPEQCGELQFLAKDDPAMEGAFKTPSLRGIAERAPYMHAGQLATLDDVVRHYVSAPVATVGHSELVAAAHAGKPHTDRKPIELSEAELADLVRFLGSLSAPVVESTVP